MRYREPEDAFRSGPLERPLRFAHGCSGRYHVVDEDDGRIAKLAWKLDLKCPLKISEAFIAPDGLHLAPCIARLPEEITPKFNRELVRFGVFRDGLRDNLCVVERSQKPFRS